MLIELMARCLGIRARQKHVKAVTKVPVEDHISFFINGKSHAKDPETRHCKIHKKEQLLLLFNLNPPSINEGEGCCQVGSRLFASHAYSLVGIPRGRRSAAHHILIELEKIITGKIGYFQFWSYQDKQGNSVACTLPACKSGAGNPYPRVPNIPT